MSQAQTTVMAHSDQIAVLPPSFRGDRRLRRGSSWRSRAARAPATIRRDQPHVTADPHICAGQRAVEVGFEPTER